MLQEISDYRNVTNEINELKESVDVINSRLDVIDEKCALTDVKLNEQYKQIEINTEKQSFMDDKLTQIQSTLNKNMCMRIKQFGYILIFMSFFVLILLLLNRN